MEQRFVSMVCMLLGLMVGVSCASKPSPEEPPPAASWAGLWVAERSYGPSVHGPLTVQRSGERWIARIQGDSVDVDRHVAEDGSIVWSFTFFEFGRFVGRQATDGATIKGHWIQAPGMIDNNPLATPVRLDPAGHAAYDGRIDPYPQDLSLNIALIADGTQEAWKYRAFLRNPQRNLGMFFRIDSVTVDGDALRFADADGEELAVGQTIELGERFTLLFPRYGETLDFTRRERHDAPGFYPRRSPDSPETLPRPAETGDGWRTAAPSETGLAEPPLLDLIGSLAAFEPTELRQPYLHALLIAHRGRLVVEEYFHGYHRETTHDSRSAGKTIASVLLGIALRRGDLASLDQPVYPLFGGVEAFENPDSRKERMTIRHLITMSSGFDCDDGNGDSPGNEDTMQSQAEQPDWYRYTLDLPMVREPGEAGVYCTAGLNLVGAVLRESTGSSLLNVFHDELAVPLEMSTYHLSLSPTEQAYMGGGLRLRPRDFLKIGQLYLDGGVWKGRRIVSGGWVRESAAAHASLNDPDDYGFAWWRRSWQVDGRTIETFYASGNGGQMLFVVPELDLAVQIQAGNYSDGRTRNAFRDRLMHESILPAAVAASAGS